MFLTYSAYLALIVCIGGALWRIGRWCFITIGPDADAQTPAKRLGAMISAVVRLPFSADLWKVIQSLVLDVLLQRGIARQSILRWIMHMSLCYGVLLLILMHALDDLILTSVVDDHASTLNPFMFLRNLLGFFMGVGLLIAFMRRRRIPVLKQLDAFADRLTLALLACVLFSGIALEATQIVSAPLFDEMVVDYWGSDDEEEILSLKAYWADQFDVVFATRPDMDGQRLEAGQQIHIDFCADCHSRPQSAFMAYPLAKALKPVAAKLNGLRPDMALWYVHFLSSCLALAYLPFGKLFHLISVPLSHVIARVSDCAGNRPENRTTRRALSLDACTHCCVCSQHCSVATIRAVVDNPDILPSEKLGDIGQMAMGRLETSRLAQLAQGAHICTACGRCTDHCPSAIDLHDLWLASENELHRKGLQSPHGWIRTRNAAQWADEAKARTASAGPTNKSVGTHLTANPDTFWACVQCTTCTNVCPVVAASDDPRHDLDMTPQQVMNLMRLELKEAALGCRMVWDCVTCYKCQEHCPQGVPVADVLYELRNEACARLTPTPQKPRASKDNP